jgi:hypothetical protein
MLPEEDPPGIPARTKHGFVECGFVKRIQIPGKTKRFVVCSYKPRHLITKMTKAGRGGLD